MAEIIAGLYEKTEEIGAGGGGVVYLGRHIRLDKPVVLKCDKRTLMADTGTLRREVDLLKGLTHTYIPQVYDFVQENDEVYTVMDYIEGESLDKLIKRGEIPSQGKVIKWACQLLEALVYLHSRPPHGILHGDIKPANIMLRPNGDVCLIDYNIALALGEDGAVRVGFSRGYASPEHYGYTYVSERRAGHLKAEKTDQGTVPQTDKEKKPGIAAPVDDRIEIVPEDDDHTEAALHDDDRTETVSSEDNGTEAALHNDDRTEAVSYDKARTAAFSADTDRKESFSFFDKMTESSQGGHGSSGAAGGSGSSSSNGVLLDVRSDIYSLGATLYHLISGHRPAEKAEEVTALSKDICSPAVAGIILKAMKPAPDDRYQTAAEMLQAFRDLYKNDARVIRRKRRIAAVSAALTVVFLAGCGLTFVGLKQMEQQKNALALAEYSSNALAEGNVTEAVRLALEAIPGGSIFDAPVTAQAQKSLTEALGVYQLSDKYRALDTIALPSEPFHTGFSGDGRYLAAVFAYELGIYDMADRKQTVSLKTQESALSDFVFIDDNTIIYAGDEGITSYDIGNGSKEWTGAAATTIALSGDGKRIAAVNRSDPEFFVYDTGNGAEIFSGSFGDNHLPVAVNDIFADPDKELFALNEKGSLLAASLDNGALIIYDLEDPGNDIIILEESDYESFAGGFVGDYFVFSANKPNGSDFGIIDIKIPEQIAEYHSNNELILKTADDSLYLADGGVLVSMSLPDFEQKEIAYVQEGSITGFDIGAENLIAAVDKRKYIIFDKGGNQLQNGFVNESADFLDMAGKYILTAGMNKPDIAVLSLEDHTGSDCFRYDPGYAHDEARISADGKTAVLFDINAFGIFDEDGKKLADIALPDPDSIYDQQFIRDVNNDSYLEVMWYDGTVRDYSARDGSIIKEEKSDAPEKNLYEEFLTEKFRVASSLHEAPVVYDRETDKQLAVLQEEAYLTYVTETGYGLMTEYISTDGERYGVLLNDRFEPIAVLPGLCDVYEDKVYFDYKSGNLRQSRLYSVTELKTLGEEKLKQNE